MMSRHFRLSSELTGAIAKRPPHAKNHHSVPGGFFNQFVTDIYIYTYTTRTTVFAHFMFIILRAFTTKMGLFMKIKTPKR